MVNIWNQCEGKKHIQPLHETAWRVIEAQEITATRKLVDSLEEQILLEDMLESSKPILDTFLAKFHPLLYTPFRYPPLTYGSRFGMKIEPSLWYGSLSETAAMAEKAFYQFNFLRGSDAAYGLVEVPLTIFSAKIKTTQGIKLSEAPFSQFTNIISSPVSYVDSQVLGSAMRESAVEAFTYMSARDKEHGKNIALFTINAFAEKNPEAQSFQSWQCIASKNSIEFVRSSAISNEVIRFSIDEFIHGRELPFPAN